MEIVNKLRSYLLEEEFVINVYQNKVNVVNYKSIDHFDVNKVIIRYEKGSLVITGNNLFVSRLVVDEVLIEGIIKNIELR